MLSEVGGAPLLRAGDNELVLLELEGAVTARASFVAGMELGEVEE